MKSDQLPAPSERGLRALEECVRRDLDYIKYPEPPWVPRQTTGEGSAVLDVLVVGAGHGGLAVGVMLQRERVDNVLIIDRAARGHEGPWRSYARMPTLRSWKTVTGPDLGVPSLTFQSWFEAQWGADEFARMNKIPTTMWHDYLLWIRDVLALPVKSEVELLSVEPRGKLLCATLKERGVVSPVLTRKIILAMGIERSGRWWMPSHIEALPKQFRAHTSEHIDFRVLAGRRVAVLGAGASAFDNAATALEAGAREVHLFCRRAEPMVVQPYRWITFAGFLRHLHEMDDSWRWRFMHKVLSMREGFTQASWDRCARHANFTLHTGRPWVDARVEGGRVALETAKGPFVADFAIAATGVRMDAGLVPELAAAAPNIATWADRYTPPPEAADARLGAFPYLSADGAFTERRAGETPWIADIHLFGIGTTMSFGPAGASINAMAIAAPRLAAGVTRGLFAADLPRLWDAFAAYDQVQAVVDPERIAS